MTPEERAGSFHAKPLWQRAAVVAAGPIANFLLAILIFAVMFTFIGMRSTEARIGEVMPDTPAARAGFKQGDLIVAIDGRKVESFNDVLRVVSASPEQEMVFTVDRGGAKLDVKVDPGGTRVPRRGRRQDAARHDRHQAGDRAAEHRGQRRRASRRALALGVQETQFVIVSTLHYVGDVFTGRQRADQLGGPVRIAEVSGQVAKIGLEPLLQLVAVISVSVGLINLFPIPLLDGGHLMFYAIEAIRRRPMSERSQEIGFRIGLALVLMLMVFAFWNDRFIVWRWITGAS